MFEDVAVIHEGMLTCRRPIEGDEKLGLMCVTFSERSEPPHPIPLPSGERGRSVARLKKTNALRMRSSDVRNVGVMKMQAANSSLSPRGTGMG